MDFLTSLLMGTPVWMWACFISLVAILLAADLGVLHRTSREITLKESLASSAFYILVALLFGAWIWIERGATSGKEYLTGFLVEKSLSLDNLFVISLIFGFLAIPPRYQHRVLFWGILGVIVLRAVTIGAGAVLVARFHWILYVFAAFLVFTGVKMLVTEHKPFDLDNNWVLRLLQRHLRVTPELHGERFVVSVADARGTKIRHVTPLFVALILIELVDLVFAVDSIPAIFAISTDPFIVYTSNIFAILGLRALYFALAAAVGRFVYLKQALAILLVFIGSKLFVADLMGWDKFPPNVSLAVTLGVLFCGIAASILKPRSQVPPPVDTKA